MQSRGWSWDALGLGFRTPDFGHSCAHIHTRGRRRDRHREDSSSLTLSSHQTRRSLVRPQIRFRTDQQKRDILAEMCHFGVPLQVSTTPRHYQRLCPRPSPCPCPDSSSSRSSQYQSRSETRPDPTLTLSCTLSKLGLWLHANTTRITSVSL
jgi:hypothetical protein